MDPESRTARSIKNSYVALIFYAISFILSFFSRKIFLDHLGPDILGLNATAASLFGFLNLAELGIGTAIAVTLYKPLQAKDQQAINEIVSLQGWFYARVAAFIIFGSCVMMCFFPRIFGNTGLPLWYAYATFSVMLFGSMLGYFANYRQIVLGASQQGYKIQRTVGTAGIIRVLVQMAAVSWLPNPYVWWLVIQFLFAILCAWILDRQIKITAPGLKTRISDGAALRKKYPDILTKVKQLFVHKIGAFALNQTSPIIIYAYATLTMVTMYGNYTAITQGMSAILSSMFSSMNAGVGNLIAEGKKDRIMRVFRELFSSRFVVIATFSIGFYLLTAPFVTLWIGAEYIFDRSIVLLIVILFFIRTSRETVDSYINGYGLFQDIWAPGAEAALNIGLSVLFGYFWGLKGILCGVLLSQIAIILIWKPYLLFKKGLEEPISIYVKIYAKHVAIMLLCGFLASKVMELIPIDPAGGWLKFAAVTGIVALFCVVFMTSILYLTENGMRDFFHRAGDIIHKR